MHVIQNLDWMGLNSEYLEMVPVAPFCTFWMHALFFQVQYHDHDIRFSRLVLLPFAR